MRILSFLFLFILLNGCEENKFSAKNIPQAKQGVIDFSEWDFSKNGNAWLNGEWEFYWSQLLAPLEIENEIPTQYIQVPQPWNQYSDQNNNTFPVEGFATFRLKIKAPQHNKFSIRITEIRDAYQLWVNGDLAVEHGKVGKNESTTIPRSDAKMITFSMKNGEADLVFQVSNFRSSKAGFIRKSFLLGTESQIQKTQFRSIANVLFLVGCYLIIGIYHLLFYQMRRRNKGALFFAALCFLSIIRVLTTGDKLMIYWTNISTVLNSQLAYLSIYLAIPFFFKYLRTFFPKEISKRFIQAVYIYSWVLSAFILLAPNRLSYLTNHPFQFLILAGTLYLAYALTLVLKKKRNGGVLLTIGMLIVVLAAWNDTFYEDRGFFHGFLFPFGILAFMMLQTFFLAKVFATNMDNIRKLSDTFRKFVPEQFLKRLDQNAKNVIPIGIAQEEMLTISFSDIRSFSKISEQMTSQELLVFLNNFFDKMDQPIRKNFGFIDKYIGDSIMSVFDRKEKNQNIHAFDAVNAAINMHRIQKKYEDQVEGAIPIQFGIGIHTGKVILGTVGSNRRMDSTVIGDSVNLASRLESLTKYYGAQIIISETTRQLIHSDDFLIRELDKVVVKGKSNIVSIYEIFDGDTFEIKKMKVKSLPVFEEALQFYFAQKWEDAILKFEKSLDIYPNDEVAKMYVKRCLQFQKKPPTENWKGEYIYDVK